MASIVWRDDRKRWYAYYHIRNAAKHTGRALEHAPRKKNLTKRERVEAMAEAERLAEDAQRVPMDEIDFETAAANFLDECKQSVKFRTWERYKSVILQFVKFVCPDDKRIPLREVTELQIRQWRDERLKTHQASTVRNDLKSLSALFSWLRRQRDPVSLERLLKENPLEFVEHPKVIAKKEYFPTDEEVSGMIYALRKSKQRDLYGLGLFGALAGCRASDAYNMPADEVDLEKRTIRVANGKSKWPRIIPMHDLIYNWLMDGALEDWVFPSAKFKKQACSNALDKKFNAWMRENGFRFTHKALRKWFNNALRQHPALSDAARMSVVGHEDAAVNRDHYSLVKSEESAPFVQGLLSGQPKPKAAPR